MKTTSMNQLNESFHLASDYLFKYLLINFYLETKIKLNKSVERR